MTDQCGQRKKRTYLYIVDMIEKTILGENLRIMTKGRGERRFLFELINDFENIFVSE